MPRKVGRHVKTGENSRPIIGDDSTPAQSKFFDLARLQKAPIAIEAIERIDALFAVEREINGLAPEQRLAVRNERSRPLVVELESWLRQQRAKLSRRSETAKAIDYSLKRWTALTRFLGDGRLCMSNNAAERAVRCVAVGRKNWTFAGSDDGGHRAAAIYTLIETAKLNGIDPQAWLADVLARLPDHPARRLDQLLPWNWRTQNLVAEAAGSSDGGPRSLTTPWPSPDAYPQSQNFSNLPHRRSLGGHRTSPCMVAKEASSAIRSPTARASDRPHRVAGFNRNGWPTSVGIGGRIASESVADFRRIAQPSSRGGGTGR